MQCQNQSIADSPVDLAGDLRQRSARAGRRRQDGRRDPRLHGRALRRVHPVPAALLRAEHVAVARARRAAARRRIHRRAHHAPALGARRARTTSRWKRKRAADDHVHRHRDRADDRRRRRGRRSAAAAQEHGSAGDARRSGPHSAPPACSSSARRALYVAWSNWSWRTPTPYAARRRTWSRASRGGSRRTRTTSTAGSCSGRSYSVLEQYPLADARLSARGSARRRQECRGAGRHGRGAGADRREGARRPRRAATSRRRSRSIRSPARRSSTARRRPLRRGDLPLARERFSNLLALNPPENVRADSRAADRGHRSEARWAAGGSRAARAPADRRAASAWPARSSASGRTASADLRSARLRPCASKSRCPRS